MNLRTVVLDLDELDSAAVAAVKAAAIVGRSCDAEVLTAMLDEEAGRVVNRDPADTKYAVAVRVLTNPSLMRGDDANAQEIVKNYHCRRTNTPAADVGVRISLMDLKAKETFVPGTAPAVPAPPVDTVGRNV